MMSIVAMACALVLEEKDMCIYVSASGDRKIQIRAGIFGESGAVDHAADRPVESDVVEVPLLCRDL